MRRPIAIEVALNGPWGQARVPHLPIAPEALIAQGIACAEAGAAVIHLHAYDTATGRQNDDWRIYAGIIEGIRARVDAIVYPTIPLAGSGLSAGEGGEGEQAGPEPGARFAHLEELGRRGLLDWAVVDPGSVNFLGADNTGTPFLYRNTVEEVRAALAIASRHKLRPSYAIYEPGFARAGAVLAREARVKTPVYRLMFSDRFAWGFPPRVWALEAYRALLAEVAPAAPWMVAGLGVDITPLIPAAVASGGHVRVGIEDAPWDSTRSNLDWVLLAVASVEAAGGAPMTAAQLSSSLSQ
jgi:uncharacterized protein (DUF849 family)